MAGACVGARDEVALGSVAARASSKVGKVRESGSDTPLEAPASCNCRGAGAWARWRDDSASRSIERPRRGSDEASPLQAAVDVPAAGAGAGATPPCPALMSASSALNDNTWSHCTLCPSVVSSSRDSRSRVRTS